MKRGETRPAAATVAAEAMDEDVVDASLRIINAQHQLLRSEKTDLQRLSELVGADGKLHQCRPTMLSCRLMTKRVQFLTDTTSIITDLRVRNTWWLHLKMVGKSPLYAHLFCMPTIPGEKETYRPSLCVISSEKMDTASPMFITWDSTSC